MGAEELLGKIGIEPDKPILLITAHEALDRLMDTAKEYCSNNIRFDKMTKEEIQTLLSSYAECVFDYHPENSHQERAALVQNSHILKKYGLTNEDYNSLDFC